MLRHLRIAVGLLAIVSMAGRDASAQWGFDGWGWMGWGVGTPEGAALQGAGQFAMGAGIYNLKTAQAEAINADTAMRFNDYVADVTRESARIHAARKNEQIAKNRALYNKQQQQLRDNPTRRDIELGDALNAAVEDLNDPRIGSAAIRATKAHVPASLIADVPFLVASERITFMMDNLRSTTKWSDVFEGGRFDGEKKKFDDLVARLREQAYDGDLSPTILSEARGFLNDLRSKLDAQPLADPNHQKEALRFVTACSAMVTLLEKPNIRPAILELRNIQDTMLSNLLGFMSAYNLRFGPAREPNQRRAYAQLWEILDQTRDQILAEAKLDTKSLPPSDPKSATDFFERVDKGRTAAGSGGATPRSPNP
jgi:hypothetical protein